MMARRWQAGGDGPATTTAGSTTTAGTAATATDVAATDVAALGGRSKKFTQDVPTKTRATG